MCQSDLRAFVFDVDAVPGSCCRVSLQGATRSGWRSVGGLISMTMSSRAVCLMYNTERVEDSSHGLLGQQHV